MNFYDLMREIEGLFIAYKYDNPNCHIICEIMDTKAFFPDHHYEWDNFYNIFNREDN